jgi:hypothetical protein
MAVTFNPFTGNLDFVGSGGGGGTPGGSDTQVQFNDDGAFGGSADLTWDDTGKVLEVGGDINLDDGGANTLTLQTVTPTAARTISFPDATGTVGLVAGSSGQVTYNNAGAYAGLSTVTTDGTNVTLTGRFISSLNGAASAPPGTFTGTWFTGGTSTTTKPQVLIEPSGATSTAWSTSGTGLGVNAASGFAGNLLDLQVNGTSVGSVTSTAARFGITNHNVRLGSFNSVSTVNWYYQDTIRGQIIGGVGTGHEMVVTAGTPGGTTGALVLTASVVEQRRGTSAQTTRIYNTFTSATNFERAKLQWDTNVLKVGTEKGADGGTARDMELQTDDTTRITLKANGAILFAGLPTSDPAVAGQLWNDGNTLKISAG